MNKNTLIVGDIHYKASIVLPEVDKNIKKYNINQIIFVGDYFDDWGVEKEEGFEEINKLIDWKLKKEDEGIKIIFLTGNHDYAYISTLASCSGHNWEIELFASKRLSEYMNVQLAAEVNGYLITHAGVTKDWARQWLKDISSAEKISSELNKMFKKATELAGKIAPEGRRAINAVNRGHPIWTINHCGHERGGWDRYSGPLWCGQIELITNSLPGIKQIVGHTPVDTCKHSSINQNDEVQDLWFCDTFSTFSNNKPIGDHSMLLLTSNEEIKIINKFNDNEQEIDIKKAIWF